MSFSQLRYTNEAVIDGETPIQWVTRRGDIALAETLPQSPDVEPDLQNAMGQMSLGCAAKRGLADIVRLILGIGAVNPNSKDIWNRTSLSCAAAVGSYAGNTHWHDYIKIVKLLLNTLRVNPDFKDHMGRIPLLHAAHMGHMDIVELLMRTQQVYLNSRDFMGRNCTAASCH